MSSGDKVSRGQGGGVTTIPDAGAVNFDARFCRNFTIITNAGCTATYSRVADTTASAHVSGAENGGTVAATTKLVTAVDWPCYRVSASGGSCRVALV